MDVDTLSENNLKTLGIPDWRRRSAFEPFKIKTARDLSPEAVDEIVNQYYMQGIVLVEVTDESIEEESVKQLTCNIGLGEPYTPSQYNNTRSFAANGVSRMREDDSMKRHPSFHSTAGQFLHCDGTLEPMGGIPTSALACHENAFSGGDTFFLNATQALHELCDVDFAAASALFGDGVLVRTANIEGVEGSSRGPAFAIYNGELITRASFSSTDTWSVSGNSIGCDLARGIAYLIDQANDASPLYRRIRLQRNQIVLFANDKLSHGRDSYVNTPDQVRDISRALFSTRPRKVSEGGEFN